MTRPRRTQRRSDGHRKNLKARRGDYQPHGGVPWPTLADGTMYRPEMPVALVRDDGEMEFTWTGRLLWVTWMEEEEWVHPDKRKPKKGRWKASVDWGAVGRPSGLVWLDELVAGDG